MMTDRQILAFEEALAASPDNQRRHLLLGNGFSIALKPDIFTYGTLYEHADFHEAPHAVQIFDALETRDFEAVIKTLVEMAKVLRVYEGTGSKLAHQIEHDAAVVKDVLVQAIASRHPSRPYDVTDDQYRACRSFLSRFANGNVYTLNYDVLFYWALMHEDLDEFNLTPDDGFRAPEDDPYAEYVSWQSYHSPRIHYCRGALHLFDAGHELQKYTWSRTDIAIIDQIRAALDHEQYPLFVSEGHTDAKLARIMHSGYLHKALRSLEGIGGSLFIFGHSLHANDEHVLRAIERSNIRRLFVSLHGDPGTAPIRISSSELRQCKVTARHVSEAGGHSKSSSLIQPPPPCGRRLRKRWRKRCLNLFSPGRITLVPVRRKGVTRAARRAVGHPPATTSIPAARWLRLTDA